MSREHVQKEELTKNDEQLISMKLSNKKGQI